MSAEDLSIEALVERYNALTQDVVEALNAEFQRHGCSKVTAKFDPSKRWVRIHHQSDALLGRRAEELAVSSISQLGGRG